MDKTLMFLMAGHAAFHEMEDPGPDTRAQHPEWTRAGREDS